MGFVRFVLTFAVLAIGSLSVIASAVAQQTPAPTTPAQPVITLQAFVKGGDSFQGTLQSIKRNGSIDFQVNRELRTVPASAFISWGAIPITAEYPQIVLQDGSIIHAEILSVSTSKIQIESKLWQRQSLPTDQVAALFFTPSADVDKRVKDLQTILSMPSSALNGPLIWLSNNDTVNGKLTTVSRTDTGLAQTNTKRIVEIEAANGEQLKQLSLPLNSIKAARLSAVRLPSADAVWLAVGTRDGSILHARSVSQNAKGTEFTTTSGLKLLAYSNERQPWSTVCFLQSHSKSVTYLSNVELIRHSNTGMFKSRFPVKADQSVTGGPLLLNGSRFLKGIGMHSTGNAVYSIPSGSTRFSAELAIDDSAGDSGSVVYKIYLLSEKKWNEAYQSDVIRGNTPPVSISLPIAKQTAIALVVESADYGDILDRANWLNARLEQPQAASSRKKQK